ncbi:MAG: hypothetical protein MI923_30355 [Phycisphaerales bacterium]|nr:hypothetical protein [Phycisphaerales bacterium]
MRRVRPSLRVVALRFVIVLVTANLLVWDKARAEQKLLDIVPDDAVVICLVEKPKRALPPATIESLLENLAPDAKDADTLVKAIKQMPGGFVMGYVPSPVKKKRPVFFMALEWSHPSLKFDKWLEKTLPAFEAVFKNDRLKLDQTGNAIRIATQSGDETVFAFALKGRVAFGSNKPQLALQWLRGDWPEKRWIGMPGVRKMLKRLPEQSTIRVLLNPKPWLERLRKPAANSLEELAFKVLSPDEVLGAAIDFSWERTALKARLTCVLAEGCQGVGRILTRPTSSARCLGVFPEDFLAIGRLGWSSAAGVVKGLYALTDRFDETISTEYREDLVTFRETTGVLWDTAILGQLVDEVAFGLRVDYTRRNPIGWGVVLPLGDQAVFSQALEQLIANFDLALEEVDENGLRIRTPADPLLPLSFAMTQGLLIVGDGPETVHDIAREAGDRNRGKPKGANLRACYEALGDPNHFVVMLDIEQLKKMFPVLSMAVGSQWAPLLAQGSVGVVVGVDDRVAHMDIHWSLTSPGRKRSETRVVLDEPGEGAPLATLLNTLVESTVKARLQAQRVKSMHTQRALAQSLYLYAEKHGGAFPESLEELFRAMPDTVNLEMLISPYDGEGPASIAEVNRGCYLVYRSGLTTRSAPTEVLMAERELHGDGASFLFLDGHVEFIQDPKASELLDQIAAGEKSVGL